MGVIRINVPQNIQVEYFVSASKLIDQLLEQLQQMGTPTPIGQDLLLGLFADDSELVDTVTESAMQARNRDSLRAPNGKSTT